MDVLVRAVEGWCVRQSTSDAPHSDAAVVLSFGFREYFIGARIGTVEIGLSLNDSGCTIG